MQVYVPKFPEVVSRASLTVLFDSLLLLDCTGCRWHCLPLVICLKGKYFLK